MSSSPDIPKGILEDEFFLGFMTFFNPHINLPTRKIVHRRLWDQFRNILLLIPSVVCSFDFNVLTFDGWSSHRKRALWDLCYKNWIQILI